MNAPTQKLCRNRFRQVGSSGIVRLGQGLVGTAIIICGLAAPAALAQGRKNSVPAQDSVIIEVEAGPPARPATAPSKNPPHSPAQISKRAQPSARKLTSPPPALPALTDKEQRLYEHWVKFLADPAQSQVQAIADTCGAPIPLSIAPDFTTEFMAANTHAGQLCDQIRAALIEACRSGRAEAVRSRIASVQCRRGAPGTLSMHHQDRRLIVHIGLNALRLQESLRERLQLVLTEGEGAASSEVSPSDQSLNKSENK